MVVIDFRVDGNPLPKRRPRRNFKSGRKNAYTPPQTKKWEKKIRDAAKNIYKDAPLEEKLGAVVFVHRKTRHKVDADNILKSVFDALNKVIYKDDKQVAGFFMLMERPSKTPGLHVYIMSYDKWVNLFAAQMETNILRENNAVCFHAYGNPLPKARPVIVKLKNGKRSAYTPKRTSVWEGVIQKAAETAILGKEILKEEIGASVFIRRENNLRADADNILKSLWDGLNKIVYNDDTQITGLFVHIIRGSKNPGMDAYISHSEQWRELFSNSISCKEFKIIQEI